MTDCTAPHTQPGFLRGRACEFAPLLSVTLSVALSPGVSATLSTPEDTPEDNRPRQDIGGFQAIIVTRRYFPGVGGRVCHE